MEAVLRQQCVAGPRQAAVPAAAAARTSAPRRTVLGASSFKLRSNAVSCRASDGKEGKEYYSYKDMPPLPLTVTKITLPEIDYTVVDESTRDQRLASLAIFYDIYKDDQYRSTLSRKSALTAMCMYDKEDVESAQKETGVFPNIELLLKIYNQGMELKIHVEEFMPK